MSVYGGDSWVPEAQHRRRRVDELLSDSSMMLDDGGEIRRLANGRIACLVCPNHPLLDTMPMLMVHRKGSRHQAAAAKRSRKEFHQREQLQKRVALSLHDATSTNSPVATPLSATNATGFSRNSAPLLVETRKCTAHLPFREGDNNLGSLGNLSDAALNLSTLPGSHPVQSFSCGATTTRSTPHLSAALIASEIAPKKDMNCVAHAIPKAQFAHHALAPTPQNNKKQQQEIQMQRERELRLREAGWRSDALGGWFKEENVEFDSDEETPKFSS